MDIALLRSFLAIARRQNFHDAADDLYLTQSALTKQIKRLEQELGILLIDRSARQISLTEAGWALAEHAPAVLEAYDAMREAVNPGRLRLRVGVLPVMSFYGTLELLARFGREHPQVELSLQEFDNDRLPQALRWGEVDLIIWRCSDEEREEFRSWELCEDELALVLPSGHPLAGRETVSLREAAEENFVFLGKNTRLYAESLAACRRAGFSPHILFTGSSVENVAQLIHQRQCAALFMHQVAAGLEDPGLAVLGFAEAPRMHMVLAGPKDRPLPAGASQLWGFVRREANASPRTPQPRGTVDNRIDL